MLGKDNNNIIMIIYQRVQYITYICHVVQFTFYLCHRV